MIAAPFLAVVKRNFYLEASYRFSFLLKIIGYIFELVIFFFISRLFQSQWQAGRYGGANYFEFALIGFAGSSFFATGLSGFAYDIRQEELMGTLESLMATPLKLASLALSIYASRFFMALLDLVLLVAVGVLFFGVSIHYASALPAFFTLLLSGISFAALGMMSGSFTLVFKRGDPVSRVMTSISDLLGGVYFPPAIMPVFLQTLSFFIPTPYALHALRLCLLQGGGWAEIRSDCQALFFFALVLLPVALLGLRLAADKVRRDGSVSQY